MLPQGKGYVDNAPASDLEVRFANSLRRLDVSFSFRQRISPLIGGARNLENQWTNLQGEVEIDFLATKGFTRAVFIDGFVGHFRMPWQSDQDQIKTDIVRDFGRALGWAEPARISYEQMVNQEMSDVKALELFG